MKLKKRVTRFQKELRKQSRVAVAAAIGFLIAYAWKEYIFQLARSMLGNFTLAMPNISNFASALTITSIGVILIFISSKLLD